MEVTLSDDVHQLKSLIGKTTTITTIDDKTHEGIIFVIDPVFKNVILAQDVNRNTYELVMQHAIKSITILPTQDDEKIQLEFLKHHNEQLLNEFDKQHVDLQKLRLKKWLQQMLVHVVEEDDGCLQVEEHLSIYPPYGREDCMCNNTIVLQRIQSLIDLMPTT